MQSIDWILKLYIKAHKLIATHCRPAFEPNTSSGGSLQRSLHEMCPDATSDEINDALIACKGNVHMAAEQLLGIYYISYTFIEL